MVGTLQSARRVPARAGLARRDVVAIVATITVLGAIALVVSVRQREDSRFAKDAQNVRGIVQALVVCFSRGQGDYPRPTYIEPGPGGTVPETGRAKDTSAGVISILIWNNLLTPEQVVSPRETNPRIKPHTAYQYSNPSAAVQPENALWDPSFNVDFTRNDRDAHLSYASLVITDSRVHMWTDSYSSSEAVVANRAPQITSVTPNPSGMYGYTLAQPQSKTFSICGDGKRWGGHVAFNDNHVEFFRSPVPDGSWSAQDRATYKGSGRTPTFDTWFYDEPDDPKDANIMLGIFPKAGATMDDFRLIWD